jgi:predicted TIM-barrel fold metal-dependent hydrolase
MLSASSDARFAVRSILFGTAAMVTAVDWIHSPIGVKFPEIKISLTEGGIGWVPAGVDRLNHSYRYTATWWSGPAGVTPLEIVRRNMWFCMLEEPSTIPIRDVIGVDRIMFEVDYPHADSSWPDRQELIDGQLGAVPPDDVRRITWQNASELFQHPVPAAVQADPNAF